MKQVTEMSMKELKGILKELTMQTIQCCDLPTIHAIEDEIEYRHEGGKRNETK